MGGSRAAGGAPYGDGVTTAVAGTTTAPGPGNPLTTSTVSEPDDVSQKVATSVIVAALRVAEKTAGRAQGERGWVRLELESLEATWRHAISHFWLVDAELHMEGAHVVAQAARVAGGIAVSALQSLRVLEWPRAPDVQHDVAVALRWAASRDHGGRAGRGRIADMKGLSCAG